MSQTITDLEGVVKWFDPRKGYGFIVGPEGQDIFVHFSVITGEGFRILRDNATVVYSAEKSDKGWKATSVTRQDEEEPEGEAEVVVRRGYARTPRR